MIVESVDELERLIIGGGGSVAEDKESGEERAVKVGTVAKPGVRVAVVARENLSGAMVGDA